MVGKSASEFDYGVAAFIDKDANSLLDFVNRESGAVSFESEPGGLVVGQHRQMSSYFKDKRL